MSESEDAGFHGFGALETPCVLGGGFGEVALDGSFGFEEADVFEEEFIVGGALFRGHDGDLAGEAVAEGVEGGAAFAFLGAGTGRFRCIAAVGFELLFGDGFGLIFVFWCHGCLFPVYRKEV